MDKSISNNVQEPVTASTWRSAQYLICNLLLLLLSLSQWFIPISDYDFWWHISTGQYILEQKSLPASDPFSFTFIEHDTEAPERPPVILKSYWLSQIVLYLVYAYGGAIGTIFFKILVFFLVVFVLFRHLAVRAASQTVSFLMLAALIFFSKEYMTERPQIFSFFFAALCLVLLEEARTGKKSYWFLPPLMLLWANMHGGFLVGIAFILVYSGCLTFRKRPGKEKFQALSFYLLSIFITLLNPASYHTATFFMSFQESALMKETLEFQSPLRYIRYLNPHWYPLFAFIILSYVAVGAEVIRRIKGKTSALPFEHGLLLAGTSLATLFSMRYGYFFMIVAVPVISLWLSRLFPIRYNRYISISFFAATAVLSYYSPFVSTIRSDVMIDETFIPFQAVQFIKTKALPPRIYNDISIGGYMIWKLYPEYKVFSDTRTLNPEIYRQYMSILGGKNSTASFGVPEWKGLLDLYGIRTIIHKTIDPYSGDIYPLTLNLLKDDSWHLVYFDGIVAIMTRDMQPGLFEFPKNMLLRQMRWEIDRGLVKFPDHPGFLRSLNMISGAL